MIERERKFLVSDTLGEIEGKPKQIKQGYLMLDNGGRQLRVRLIDDSKAFICYKYKVSETDKQEYEYRIGYEEGVQLYESARYKLEKTRYTAALGENIADFDVYPSGLRIVEIEYSGELKEIPAFCGEEVTGNPKYSNISLAMNGEWK